MKIKYSVKEYTGKVPLGSIFKSGKGWIRKETGWVREDGKLSGGWTTEKLDEAYLSNTFKILK